ncbi:aminoglycoside phosphotransferase family protein [Leptolyngbya sp. FACHB-261]|uniref:aminoglycoside phosphotransferase family protein n=1 Tax=Leptolyngbya sp. FACHB-261 TaxID=2692806 RepID=UPI0016880E76|nr:aminoglycoside phosphotransferase family protein [Leptolyngbya sp. FACHB-261]MBD2105285.1 aminoglycoside phosphotransferase family protein [Leptolyngbya sp. FACHB-261]
MKLIDSQNSDVAILGNIVIRRPRHIEAIAGVRRESTVLPRLRDLVVLPIPEMQLVEIGDEVIALHQQLPGESLWSVENLPDLTQEGLAAQLGSFLKSLHDIEPISVSALELPHIDQSWWRNFRERAEQLVFPELASTNAEALRSQIESHIEELPNLPCTLRHGDFGSSNILWDGEKTITGIIDFASLGWGEPGWDIAGLYASYGSPFVERLASTYPGVKSFLERAPFYRLMFALMDAVFGAEHSDQKIFNCGLTTLNLVA